MYSRQIEQVFLWIIRIGLWIIPFLPLYVASSMLFPFITGKNFAFRIIVEIVFVFWAGLAAANPLYRPKLTPLFKVATIFIAILFFADLFGANPYRSFFANYERMEGFMMLVHLYIYFIMLASVFTRRDWMFFFHATLVASLLVSYVGILQKFGYKISLQGGFRVDSTIGNPTYLAAYLVFHVWILLMLMYQYWKVWWREAIYAAALIFELAIIYFTATRGAILALIATGILFLAALIVWRPAPSVGTRDVTDIRLQTSGVAARSLNRFAYAMLTILVVFSFLFWLMRGTDFVQQNQVLRRLTNYSIHEDTIRARFMIWDMSWKGFLEHPILGWGQENYYLVFQKYYHPGLYNDEPWFDRSHNIFFDWLIHAGILGLASYLSIVGVACWAIFRAVQKGSVAFWSGLALVAAFLSHFMQNIFVFDSLNTYLLFFALLAYTHTLVYAEDSSAYSAGQKSFALRGTNWRRGFSAAGVLGVILLLLVYPLHLKPIYEADALIGAMQAYQSRARADDVLGRFRDALSYGSFGDTEVREQLANLTRGVVGGDRFSKEEQKKFVDFTVEEFQKETARPSRDVKHLLTLGSLLNRSLELNSEYAIQAGNLLEEAKRLSHTKQAVAFELAQLYVLTGKNDRAAEVLFDAWNLEKKYTEAGVNAWIFAALSKNQDIVVQVASTISLNSLREQDLYRLAQVYQQLADYDSGVKIYEALVNVSPKNAKYRATYAALLAQTGRIGEAKIQTAEAVRLDPMFAKDAEIFLEALQGR